MQHDNNKTDKQLRQLETQALPDLSRMDEHWQQMKAQIQPVAKLSRRRYYYLTAACIGGILVVVSYFMIIREKPDPVITQIIDPVGPKQVAGDTVPSNMKTGDSFRVVTTAIPFSRVSPDSESTADTGFYLRHPFIRIGPGSMSDSAENNNNPRATLEQFFSELEKPSQEFVINNEKDTVINGAEGSSLLVRAHTFGGAGPVTIVLKEYFSYEDIITNRLNTWSYDKQLITGGMMHVSAMQDGREVNMQPGASIRWFIPDTSATMRQMQLFTGVNKTDKQRSALIEGDGPVTAMPAMDSTADGRFSGMTWNPQSQTFTSTYINTSVKVLDLRDDPMRAWSTARKKVGIFCLAKKPEVSRTELKRMLKEKYHYTKVIFRRANRRWSQPIGDSNWVQLDIARQYALSATDTVRTVGSRVHTEFNWDNTPAAQRRFAIQSALYKQLGERFSVELRTLGWINCDRFLNDNRPKVLFAVDLKDTAANYHTLIAFENIKSVMEGIVAGNKVVFANIPAGETVKIISVGIQDGKPVSASETVQVSSQPFSNLRFESTTPSEFKQEIALLDK